MVFQIGCFLGVKSVREIYNYYKKFDYKTQVMGASFRNIGEILALAGCDLLTISPKFLEVLSGMSETIERKLSPENSEDSACEKLKYTEESFREELKNNKMAYEKLHSGIDSFSSDAAKLEEQLKVLFDSK